MTDDGVKQNYSLVIGNGRSGTNWLLSMLDASPLTHCRNEPQDIADSPFHALPTRSQMIKAPDCMAERWNDFATWTINHMGERDHRIIAPKKHIHRVSQLSGLAYWPVRPKIRSVIKRFFPDLYHGEWSMPWWIGKQSEISNAHGIIKINDLRAWYVRWLLQHRPQHKIIHIVRHPGGQLNSGINRFFSRLNELVLEQERHLYTSILQTVIEYEPLWADVFGIAPKDMELIEAVAWFWRYNNEEIYRAGKGRSNYLFVTYEEIASDPISYAKHIYEFCNLAWNSNIEKYIFEGLSQSMWGKLSKKSSEVAITWQNKLEPRYQVLATRVLEGSLLERYWSNASEK